jgi:hypothetical protein
MWRSHFFRPVLGVILTFALLGLGADLTGSEPNGPTTANPRQPSELPQWLVEPGPWADLFGGIFFSHLHVPERHHMDRVPHRRPDSDEPTEAAALRMILDFHHVPYDQGLSERVTVRKPAPAQLIPPQDLARALLNLPIEIGVVWGGDPYAADHANTWSMALRLIRAAVSFDLPVLVGYRPDMEIDTPAQAAVIVGYDRHSLHLLEPWGHRRPIRYNHRDFKFMFAHALFILPVADPAPAHAIEEIPIPTSFLNLISSVVLDLTASEPEQLTANLRAVGLPAVLQDVNRVDYSSRQGKTRSFARSGGIPLLEATLDRGRIAIIPQEYSRGFVGFALIYGRVGNDFAVVYFSPDQTFRRQIATRQDLAHRWLTRTDRSYRLDLIQIPVMEP